VFDWWSTSKKIQKLYFYFLAGAGMGDLVQAVSGGSGWNSTKTVIKTRTIGKAFGKKKKLVIQTINNKLIQTCIH
jgi:hypothetical protein